MLRERKQLATQIRFKHLGLLVGIFAVMLVACGRSLFEREPLSNSEIKDAIFSGTDLEMDVPVFVYSYAAVGGYVFVAKIQLEDAEIFSSKLSGYKRIASSDVGETEYELLAEIFDLRISGIFNERPLPEWFSDGSCPGAKILKYEKKIGEFTIDLYSGVRECDELYFIGMGEAKPDSS